MKGVELNKKYAYLKGGIYLTISSFNSALASLPYASIIYIYIIYIIPLYGSEILKGGCFQWSN